VSTAQFDVLASPEWRALVAHRDELADATLRDLFAAGADRAEALTFDAADLHVDASKQRITATTIARPSGCAAVIGREPPGGASATS
jgi:glucose-6-phosphate isomerase